MIGTYDLRFRIAAISTINITIEMSLQTIWRWKYCPNNYRGKKKIQNMKQHQFEKFKRRWNRRKKCPATSHSSKHTKNQNSRKSRGKRKGMTLQTQSRQQYYYHNNPFPANWLSAHTLFHRHWDFSCWEGNWLVTYAVNTTPLDSQEKKKI